MIRNWVVAPNQRNTFPLEVYTLLTEPLEFVLCSFCFCTVLCFVLTDGTLKTHLAISSVEPEDKRLYLFFFSSLSWVQENNQSLPVGSLANKYLIYPSSSKMMVDFYYVSSYIFNLLLKVTVVRECLRIEL